MKSQEEQELSVQVEQLRERLQGLGADLRVVDDEVESLAPQRTHHELLDRACGSLEELKELGAASLFWGEWVEPERIEEQLRGVRDRVSEFQAQLGELDEGRQAILTKIKLEEENLKILGEDIYHVREAEERKKLEWVVERDVSSVPFRVQIMAWARGGEDDIRFRKALGGSLLAGLVLGLLLPMINLPLPKPFVPDDMPKRLAQLVRQEQAKPIPKPAPVAEAPTEQQEPEPSEQAKPPEQQPETPAMAATDPMPNESPGEPGPENPAVAAAKRQERVAKAGILAFKDKFASLAKDKVEPRLGTDARYGDADDVSDSSMTSRSMLTTNAPGSSGGINIASLSRGLGGSGGGGGGGGGIQGVQVGRATSGIASIGGGGGGGGGRPRAGDGQAASRTDEEIQIVFDRYKASFYRLYNRELRKDPTLRGQMVLRLTIEPDGSVSMCELLSTDMDAPELGAQVVDRVRTINFGAKDDVQALTIVYPIDFLPKA
jgi:outer membrane biosynthesis protein TonB